MEITELFPHNLLASVFYKIKMILYLFWINFYFILIFITSRHQKFTGLSCWHYRHLSVSMTPSKLCLCHRHYTARLRCCIMTSLQHERRYVMTAVTRQSGTQTSLAQSHALCVAAPHQVIHFAEFNQHSNVTTKKPESCRCTVEAFLTILRHVFVVE